MKVKSRQDYRVRRHKRLRQKIRGTAERPRMSIMLSNRHMYVQFVDDEAGTTLASASSLKGDGKKNVAAARLLGQRAGEAAAAKGIRTIVVDRGGFQYHGRVKAIVEGAVEKGLVARTSSRPADAEDGDEK